MLVKSQSSIPKLSNFRYSKTMSLSYDEAFWQAMPWAAGAAAVYFLMWTAATSNLGGPSAMVQPMGWFVCIAILPWLFGALIAVPLYLAGTCSDHGLSLEGFSLFD